jgi:hypothetical protein
MGIMSWGANMIMGVAFAGASRRAAATGAMEGKALVPAVASAPVSMV